MTPVCPACRASLTLDAHVCWRCGLAVRPTCASCSEPLTHGMKACWFCHERIEEPDDAVREVSIARAAVATVPVYVPPPPRAAPIVLSEPVAVVPEPVAAPTERFAAVAQPPVAVAPAKREKRFRLGRVVVEGFFVGLLVAAGLLAYESLSTRFVDPVAATVKFTSQAFTDMGFEISYPVSWTVAEVDRRASITIPDSDSGAPRGLRVDIIKAPFSAARKQIAATRSGPQRADSVSLAIVDTTVGGAKALTHLFASRGVLYEQVWIDRGKTMLRLTFTSRAANESALAMNDRIANTLSFL